MELEEERQRFNGIFSAAFVLLLFFLALSIVNG